MGASDTEAAELARERLRAAMARLAQGDSAALEEIYEATRVKLFGICLEFDVNGSWNQLSASTPTTSPSPSL